MKLIILVFSLTFGLLANDVPTQPSLDERFELLKLQRDFLLSVTETMRAQAKQQSVAEKLDQKSTELATKFNCASWNEDFTCVPKPKEELKDQKK